MNNDNEYITLLKSCQNVFDWSEKWFMKLNINKCKVLTLAKSKNTARSFEYGFYNGGIFSGIEHVETTKDLGVVIDGDLNCHIRDKINRAFQMLGIINRNFSEINGKTSAIVQNYGSKSFRVWCFGLEPIQSWSYQGFGEGTKEGDKNGPGM